MIMGQLERMAVRLEAFEGVGERGSNWWKRSALDTGQLRSTPGPHFEIALSSPLPTRIKL